MPVYLMRFEKIDQQCIDSVFGYIRNAQKLFINDKRIYYTIPISINHICALYYASYFDKFYKWSIGKRMILSKNKLTIIQKKTGFNSAFLTKIIDRGVYHWIFRLDVVSIPGVWSTTIGIFDSDEQDDDDDYPINKRFLEGYEKGYGWSPCNAKLINTKTGICKKDDKDYGIKCDQGDIIEMFVDMNKLELSYVVNGQDFGVAFKIRDSYYQAAINLFCTGDSITLLLALRIA